MVGHNLISQIYEGIKSCDYLLILLTKSSIESQWVKKELNFALIEEIEKQKTKVIPLLFEKCQVPDSIKEKVYADFTSNFDDGFNEVIKVIRNDKDFINNNLKTETKIEDIFAPFKIPTKLRTTIFYLGEILEPSTNKEVKKEFSDATNTLTNFAKNHNVHIECYDWIEWLISEEMEKLMSSEDIAGRRLVLQKWVCGRPLYKGGIANKLSLKAKVALEIGKVLDGLSENKKQQKELKKILLLLSSNFGLSQNFNKLLDGKKALNQDKILIALTYELLYYSDYNKLINFITTLMNIKAIYCGVFLTYLPNPQSDKFIEKSELISEFLLSELNAKNEAIEIMKVAYDVTFSVESEKIKDKSKGQRFNELDLKVYSSYMSIWSTLIDKSEQLVDTNDSIKWFLLTLRLGHLFFSAGMGHFSNDNFETDVIDIQLIDKIEKLSSQLIGNKPLNNEIRKFVHDIFYSNVEDTHLEDVYLKLIPKLQECASEKFLSELLFYFLKV